MQHRRLRLIKTTIIVIAIGAVVGCASAPPLTPIADPEQRLQFNGFSVLSPNGKYQNWVGRDGQDAAHLLNATFVKRPPQTTPNTYIAMVEIINAQGGKFATSERLHNYVKNLQIMQAAPRQQIVKSAFAIDDALGPLYVRFDLEATDPSVPGWSESTFNVDVRGYQYVHFRAADFLVTIAYSRRTLQGNSPLGGNDEGEWFLNNLQLTDVQRK
ncbi:MAG: hypothetical protein OEQ39_15960 [Gammaproteobacteria bacterium]|nr:hypothetical protein [Gammaproteobacteria bacterium]MDH3467304.1 hypothetical protein [Gammaproteobacteria bacterium]